MIPNTSFHERRDLDKIPTMLLDFESSELDPDLPSLRIHGSSFFNSRNPILIFLHLEMKGYIRRLALIPEDRGHLGGLARGDEKFQTLDCLLRALRLVCLLSVDKLEGEAYTTSKPTFSGMLVPLRLQIR